MAEKLLIVKNLRTSFFTHLGEVKAIRGISFHVNKSEAIGIVGESGSGKSVTSLSIMRLLQYPGKIVGGEILFKGNDLVKKSNMELNIEIKAGSIFYPGIEEKVLKMIDKYGIRDKVIISSFDHYSLVKIKSMDKDIKTGILYSEALYRPTDYLKTTGANALHPNYITLTKDIVEEAHSLGVEINTYTVNKEEHIRMIKAMNVNAIITNYPDLAKKILSE